MIKRESLNCILVLIISVYVNFTFVYKTYPLFQYICYYGILGLYLLFHLKKVLHWVKLALKNVSISFFSLMFWIFILTNAIIFPIVHGTFDFSYINVVLSIARQIVQHCFLLVLIDNWIKPQKLTIKYMQINIGSGLCYVAVTVLMICFPHLKDFWRNTIYIPATDLAASYETNYFTRFGLVGFSGFDQTIFFTILVSFSLLLFFKNISLKENKNLYYFVSMIILLLGNTFYGRSGMMISLFCMGIGFSVFCFKYKQIRLILKLNIIFILLFLFVLIGKNYNEQLYVYYNWSLKPITNCSRSKFLSKIFKIFVKKFREIFPDYTHRKRGSDFITVPFLSSGSHVLRLPSAFLFLVPCLEYTLSALQQSSLTPHISGLYALLSN